LASMNSTVLPQPPYTSLTWPWETFSYFTNRNALWKDNDFRQFKRLWKIHRQSYARSQKKAYQDFPEVATVLEAVHTLKAVRLPQLQACPK
jgi:hypothetical protein